MDMKKLVYQNTKQWNAIVQQLSNINPALKPLQNSKNYEQMPYDESVSKAIKFWHAPVSANQDNQAAFKKQWVCGR